MTLAEYEALPPDHQRRVKSILDNYGWLVSDVTLKAIVPVQHCTGSTMYGFAPHRMFGK